MNDLQKWLEATKEARRKACARELRALRKQQRQWEKARQYLLKKFGKSWV
jgi:hypothetical protein